MLMKPLFVGAIDRNIWVELGAVLHHFFRQIDSDTFSHSNQSIGPIGERSRLIENVANS